MNDPYEVILSTGDAAALRAALDEAEALLGSARIVAPEHLPADRAAIGSTVTYREEPAGVVRIATLAPPGASGTPERVSVLSPAGLALLGRKPGAMVMSSLPNGWPFSVRLLEVASARAKEAA